MDSVKVTVFLSTYNQASYVSKALDSIFMQETDFPFEVVAADDFSTDGTRDIILEYQRRFPGRLVPFFTEQNVGNCAKTIQCFEKGLFRGDYVSMLEGDDYWLEKDHLQVLVDFLDQNSRFAFVSYKEYVVDMEGNRIGTTPDPSLWGKEFTIRDFLEGKSYSDYAGVFRNFYREEGLRYRPLLECSRNVWDFQNMFMIADHGPVYIMDRYLGVYLWRNQEGEYNYNSLFREETRRRDKIHIAEATQDFYKGRYDLTPRIRREQRKLLISCIEREDRDGVDRLRDVIPPDAMREITAMLICWEMRKGRRDRVRFMYRMLTARERKGLYLQILKSLRIWAGKKLRREALFDDRRGTVRHNERGMK